MKKLIFITPLLIAGRLFCQTITPQVINSAGMDHGQIGTSGMYYSDNIGEPFTETMGPAAGMMISQGFLQPFTIKPGYSVTIAKSDVTCKGRGDGLISLAISPQPLANQSITYNWTYPGGAAVTAGNEIDSLAPGIYRIEILVSTGSGTQTVTDTIRPPSIVVIDANEPCRITIFTGFTPNGDGENDKWVIKNITEFPRNHVSIYNRWGILIYDVDSYDNLNKVWPADEMLDKLTPSTYFYVIDLGDGTTPYRGWVEVIKN